MSANPQVLTIMSTTTNPVNLAELEIGDTITYRDKETDTVSHIRKHDNKYYPYEINGVEYSEIGAYFYHRRSHPKDIIKITKPSSVGIDLSELHVGDVIHHRNGLIERVKTILVKDVKDMCWPYHINGESYTKSGRYCCDPYQHDADIMRITKFSSSDQQPEDLQQQIEALQQQVDALREQVEESKVESKVDLSQLRLGDIIVFRSGRTGIVQKLEYTKANYSAPCDYKGNYGAPCDTYPYIVNGDTYTIDGDWYVREGTDPEDIVKIIPKD